MTNTPRIAPGWGVALAVLSVSFAAPLFALADAPPVTASFWRLAFAVVILLPFCRGSWASWQAWPRSMWLHVGVAGVALAAHFALWVWSLQLTTVAASTTLVTLQAVFVAMGGHLLLGDRLGRRAWFGVLLATAGAIWIAGIDGGGLGGGSLWGDAVALLAGLMSAVYFLVGRKARRSEDLLTYVTPVYGAAALTLLVAMPLLGQPLTAGIGSQKFVYFVLLAAVPMLGGHTAANWAIKYLSAHIVATWILLEPVGASLLAWPLLGEAPNPWIALGAVATILGAGLTVWRAREPIAEPSG